MQFHEFIQLLEAHNLKPRQLANGQWLAHCPAHDDRHASLSVTERDGRILLNCFAGCTVDAICAALGITVKDLRTEVSPKDFERRITYEVRDPNGTLIAVHERIEHNGKKTFVWRHPDGRKAHGDLKVADLPLYGVHKLQDVQFVVIVEGEKCADALWSVGVPAVATYGASHNPADEPLEQVIERATTVYLWADNDETGRRHMERIGKRLLELGATDIRWVEWQNAPEKGDAADAVELGVNIQALLDAAKPFEVKPKETPQNGATPTQSQSSQCSFCQLTADELFAKAQPVLEADDPLQAAVERIRAAVGIVGEDANLQLLLLALTTRIFPQPVNVLVTGGTGQGKSFLTDAACATLPPCCHRRIVGASARALLFHPLARGTVLQWLELPEIGGDTIAATILRSILWQAPQETATDYLFVEWTPKGARRRSIQMPRQIALVTTKVELPKDEQLLSRFLILEVRESADKRKAVLTSLAASFNGEPDTLSESVLEPVQAFHEWLGRHKVRVTIPYAYVLAELFAELPASERDFRDFATLLKLVAACALWNLQKRQHSIAGDALQVVTDIADYATAYHLLLPVWGKPRSAALSETERRVAEALRQTDHPATAEELAKAVGITDRSVRRALNSLAEKGLVERGEKRGRSYEWRLVGDLDALTVTLPTPEAVAAAWQPEPPPDQPTTANLSVADTVTDTFTDIADIHGHEVVSAKNPINTSTFGFTDKRTQEIIPNGSHDAESERQEFIIRNSGESCGELTDIGEKENRVRDVRDAKNLSPTSTFCGHKPMSANVRDVREDTATEPQKSETNHLGAQVCALCGNKLSEISAPPTCPYCWASGEEIVAYCACGEPLRSVGIGRAQCPTCGILWRWLGDHWTPDDNPDPSSPPSSELTPTFSEAQPSDKVIEVTEPNPPASEPVAVAELQTSKSERWIDTEAWVNQWWQEVLAQSDQPVVVDLETGERIPVASPTLPAKEAKCPRCGHEESVAPTVLLPPFCPACSAPMEWASAPDPPTISLLDAVKRLSDLSSKLVADSEGGGRS